MSDFKAKMHQIRFPPGVHFRPHWGTSQTALPEPLAVFKGPASKGREGKGAGEEKGKEKGREGREEMGRGRKGNGSMHPLGFSKVGACALPWVAWPGSVMQSQGQGHWFQGQGQKYWS